MDNKLKGIPSHYAAIALGGSLACICFTGHGVEVAVCMAYYLLDQFFG